jgi:hypothetical protein
MMFVSLVETIETLLPYSYCLWSHFRHVKKRAKAKKALTRLRTIANKLIRELQRKLPQYLLFEIYFLS